MSKAPFSPVDVLRFHSQEIERDKISPQLTSYGVEDMMTWTAAFCVFYRSAAPEHSSSDGYWQYVGRLGCNMANGYMKNPDSPWGKDNKPVIDALKRKMMAAP